MVGRRGRAHLALPLWLEKVFPALRRILWGNHTAVVGRHDVLVGKGDRAAIVIDQFFVHAQGFVVERFVKLAEPEARMMGIGGDHDIPFGGCTCGRLSRNLANVPGHRSGGKKFYGDVGAVFFVEGLGEGLGAVSLQSGRPVKVQGAFLPGGGDQIIQRRGGSNGKRLKRNEASGEARVKETQRSHCPPPRRVFEPSRAPSHTLSANAPELSFPGRPLSLVPRIVKPIAIVLSDKPGWNQNSQTLWKKLSLDPIESPTNSHSWPSGRRAIHRRGGFR